MHLGGMGSKFMVNYINAQTIWLTPCHLTILFRKKIIPVNSILFHCDWDPHNILNIAQWFGA